VRLLVLGGTSFVGRAMVENALSGGDEVTLFSRGRTGSELFPDLPRLRGDRGSGDYASLAEGSWDAVVDVSAYVPRHVQQAAGALEGRAGRYLFISTGSVYDKALAAPQAMAEDSARLAPERGTEEVTGETYGPLKVACEDDVRSLWGTRATIVRPGVVAGPHDQSDRSPGGYGGPPAVGASPCRAVPSSRYRSSTAATSPPLSLRCSTPTARAPTTPSARRCR